MAIACIIDCIKEPNCNNDECMISNRTSPYQSIVYPSVLDKLLYWYYLESSCSFEKYDKLSNHEMRLLFLSEQDNAIRAVIDELSKSFIAMDFSTQTLNETRTQNNISMRLSVQIVIIIPWTNNNNSKIR